MDDISSTGTWTVKYFDAFNEPYCPDDDAERCKHIETSEWQTSTKSKALYIAKDVLDIPVDKLTIETVRKDFDDLGVEECQLVKIQDYYNGRYALYNVLSDDVLKFDERKCARTQTFHYDIPEKYNAFSAKAEDEDVCKQLSSYIEVTYTKQ